MMTFPGAMARRAVLAALWLGLMSSCTSAPVVVSATEAEALAGSALEARLTNRQLTLFAPEGSEGFLVMTLRNGNLGTSVVEGTGTPEFEEVFRWTVQGDRLCTEFLAGGGIPTGQISCVTIRIAGDRITVIRRPATGGTEVLAGRIGAA